MIGAGRSGLWESVLERRSARLARCGRASSGGGGQRTGAAARSRGAWVSISFRSAEVQSSMFGAGLMRCHAAGVEMTRYLIGIFMNHRDVL